MVHSTRCIHKVISAMEVLSEEQVIKHSEGISTVFMLCMLMSFLSLLNLCHVLMGMSTNLLTDAMEL